MVAQVVPITRLRRDTATWSYLVPPRAHLLPGALVSVSLQGRQCLGIVWSVEEKDDKATRSLSEVVCARPLLSTVHRQLVEQLSLLGLCSLSTALHAWLPRSLRRSPLVGRAAQMIREYTNEPVSAEAPPQHCIVVPGRRPEQERLAAKKFGSRFSSLFADGTDTQELEAWLAVSRGEKVVGIGREGALFAPWRNLRKITLIEPEDVFYYHEQTPYLNLADMAGWLARLAGAELQTRSYLPTEAAQALWPGSGGQNVSPPLHVVDLRKEEILNAALVETIQNTLACGQRCLLLYNARDRNRLQTKDGRQSLVKMPGIETLSKQLARRLGFDTLPPSVVLGTRAIFQLPQDNIGLIAALSLDPLLEAPLFADQVHGWGDIGHLLSYGVPGIVQAYDQAHPLIQALRNGQFATYTLAEVTQRQSFALPPFGQHAVLSIPEDKLDAEAVAALRERLAILVRPPWQISFPLQASWHKKAFRTLMISSPSPDDRLPPALRRALISLPSPWKLQHNPWYLL